LEYPGSTAEFAYDAIGELKTNKVSHSGTALDFHAYDYNFEGQITKGYRANGITVDYGYDNIGQLLTAQGHEADTTPRLNENLGYAYDASGNLAYRTNNTLLQAFTTDAVNELLSVCRGGTLTAIGSTTNAIVHLGVNGTNAAIYSDTTFATTSGLNLHDGNNLFVTAGTNGAGELAVSTLTATRLPLCASYIYDLNGNLLSDGLKTYSYDDANQLTGITLPGKWKTQFDYDALGRIRYVQEFNYQPNYGSWFGINQTRYVYDGRQLLQERDGEGDPVRTYTRGLDLSGTFGGAGGIGGLLALSQVSDGSYQHYFYHSDASGNITSLTDSSGGLAARYLYDPFGNMLGQWGPMADANQFRFSSKQIHAKSGLYYYGFRFYDPSLQRWLNPDPIGEAGGDNLYRYVMNSPLCFVDPYGFGIWDDIQNFGVKVSRALDHDPEMTAVAAELSDRFNNWLRENSDLVGKGIVDSAMGDRGDVPYDRFAKGSIDAAMGVVEIDRNDNVMRNAAGASAVLVTIAAKEAAEALILKKAGEFSKGRYCSAAEKAQRLHHAWPMYLGGPVKQELEKLPKWLHDAYHSGLDKVLPRQISGGAAEFYQNLPGAQRQVMYESFRDYTKAFDKKFGTSLWKAAKRAGFSD
jgi:RHS repeat-associated protein